MKGIDAGFNGREGTFIYQYQCSLCPRKYVSSAPEEDPAICHFCYTGNQKGNVHQKEKTGRKGKHQSKGD